MEQAKLYTKAHTNYTLPRLRNNIPLALDSVMKILLTSFVKPGIICLAIWRD